MLKKDEKNIIESGIEQTVASKEKTDFQGIRDEINTIAESIADKLKFKEFASFGELREFLETETKYVKSVGKQLNDKSAGGYVILNF